MNTSQITVAVRNGRAHRTTCKRLTGEVETMPLDQAVLTDLPSATCCHPSRMSDWKEAEAEKAATQRAARDLAAKKEAARERGEAQAARSEKVASDKTKKAPAKKATPAKKAAAPAPNPDADIVYKGLFWDRHWPVLGRQGGAVLAEATDGVTVVGYDQARMAVLLKGKKAATDLAEERVTAMYAAASKAMRKALNAWDTYREATNRDRFLMEKDFTLAYAEAAADVVATGTQGKPSRSGEAARMGYEIGFGEAAEREVMG